MPHTCSECVSDKNCRWTKSAWWVSGTDFVCIDQSGVDDGMMVIENCNCDTPAWCDSCMSVKGCGWCSLDITPLPGNFMDRCMDASDRNAQICAQHGENFTQPTNICPKRDVCQTITSAGRPDCNSFDECGWCPDSQQKYKGQCRSITFIKTNPAGTTCDKYTKKLRTRSKKYGNFQELQ